MGLDLRSTAKTVALGIASIGWRVFARDRQDPVFLVGTFSEMFEGNALDFALGATRDGRAQTICVVRSNGEAQRLGALGLKAVLHGSLAEKFWLRNAAAIFTAGHASSDFSEDPGENVRRVMLWHATPMKAVGLLNKPVPDPVIRYDLIAATSPFTAKIMAESFASEGSRTVITGHPKTDRLFDAVDRRAILQRLGVAEDQKVISYLPTWRHDFSVVADWGDFGNNAGPLLRIMEELTNHEPFRRLLEREKVVFIVKPHPADDLERLRALSSYGDRVRFVAPDEIDTVDLLRVTQTVVTDYSGVLTDWLILSRPIVCFTFDYAEYWRNRGSPCFNYQEVFGSIMAYTVDELSGRLQEHLSDICAHAATIEALSQKLHVHRDAKAAVRLVDHTLQILP